MASDFVNLANILIDGTLTGLVYGLMALGLSMIFGVARVVNFAHGEIMTASMYATVVLFSTLNLDPFLALAPIAILFFIAGYLLQGKIIQPFVERPDYSQFMLLLAVAVILTNLLLILFGPDARSVRLDSLACLHRDRLPVDRSRQILRGAGGRRQLQRLFSFLFDSPAPARPSAPAPTTTWARKSSASMSRDAMRSPSASAPASVAIAGCMMTLLVDLTPALGPAYTLLAFVIVIVGGLGSMPGALVGGVLIGVSEALAGFYVTPSAKSMASFALLIAVLVIRPRGLLGDRQ